MAKYPVFLELQGRRVVVIGAGAVAVRKAQALAEVGARLVIVSDKTDDIVTGFCCDHKAELIRSKYSKDYLAGAVLVIAATNKAELNKQIYNDCQKLEILCNVVDQPELCDFFVPSVVKRGSLQIAIGTEGNCPAYAGHLRKKLEKIFIEAHGQFLTELEKIRVQIINQIADSSARKTLLGKLVEDKMFDDFIKKGPSEWRQQAQKIIKEFQSR